MNGPTKGANVLTRSVLIACVLIALPLKANAGNDLCIQYSCTLGQYSVLRTVYGTSTDELVHDSNYSCSCTASIHIPTADEIAKGFGASMQQQIQQGIEDGVKKALVEIDKAYAKREADLYKRLAEQEERANMQIKLLTDMVKALSKTTPPAKQ
jgi:hypothetical protein